MRKQLPLVAEIIGGVGTVLILIATVVAASFFLGNVWREVIHAFGDTSQFTGIRVLLALAVGAGLKWFAAQLRR